MVEYNVYAIDEDKDLRYLYTTLAENPEDIYSKIDDSEVHFIECAIGKVCEGMTAIKTCEDSISRDDLILDYIIEEDDSTSTASSE